MAKKYYLCEIIDWEMSLTSDEMNVYKTPVILTEECVENFQRDAFHFLSVIKEIDEKDIAYYRRRKLYEDN